MSKIFLCAALALMPSLGQAAPYLITPAASRIDFRYQQMGVAMQGSFRHFTGTLNLDAAQPQKSSVSLSVQTGSISLGSPDADQTAAGAEFFNIKTFPAARFQSSQVQSLGAGRYRITGTFSLKNISRPLTVDATLQVQGASQLLTGTFSLKRLDYGIGTGEWADTGTLGNDVQVNFALRLLPAAPPPSRPH